MASQGSASASASQGSASASQGASQGGSSVPEIESPVRDFRISAESPPKRARMDRRATPAVLGLAGFAEEVVVNIKKSSGADFIDIETETLPTATLPMGSTIKDLEAKILDLANGTQQPWKEVATFHGQKLDTQDLLVHFVGCSLTMRRLDDDECDEEAQEEEEEEEEQ
jgi:hypothetical protein